MSALPKRLCLVDKDPTGGQKALIVYAVNELMKGGPYSNADFWPTKKIHAKK